MITNVFVVLLLFQAFSEGFYFNLESNTLNLSDDAGAGGMCAVLQCEEDLSDRLAETRTLASLTVHKRSSAAVQEGQQWTQVVTITSQTPIQAGEGHMSGDLSDTRGHVMVGLVTPEDCLSTQFSCTAVMMNTMGQVTVVRSVIRSKLVSDPGPALDLPVAKQALSPSPDDQPGLARQLDQLTTVLSEKLKCIDTRLVDSAGRDDKLHDKIEDLKDSFADRINNLERAVGEKLQFSERGVYSKIDYLKDRLEDKLSEVGTGESANRPTAKVSSNTCKNVETADSSFKFIAANFSSLSARVQEVESAVAKSVSETTALGSKLDNVMSGVSGMSELTTNLTRLVDGLSGPCGTQEAPAPVDELFDALGNGRKDWRLAFRGTAHNNVPVYPAYLYGTGIPAEVEPGCRQFNQSLPCINHYRNYDALANWNNVDEVLFAIYVKGQMVQHIIFNGRDSSYTNWFERNRVIVSSWSDLKTLSTNYFSIAGDGRSHIIRRFLVNHFYRNCNTDKGWFMAGDHSPGACEWETKLAVPVFLYVRSNTVALWRSQKVARADSFGIFLKYK